MEEGIMTAVKSDFAVGFECTPILSSLAASPFYLDVLDGIRHRERFEYDISLVEQLGVNKIRYPASWHRVEKQAGIFEWEESDKIFNELQRRKLEVTVDLVHHVGPHWTNFVTPAFGGHLEEFALRFRERYPWIKRYTIFNEPWFTCIFSGRMGIWPPHGNNEQTFWRMFLNVARAIMRVGHVLHKEDPKIQLMQPDSFEFHQAAEGAGGDVVSKVKNLNERRFWMDELLLGRVEGQHELCRLLGRQQIAFDAEEFKQNAISYVRGLDFYPFSMKLHDAVDRDGMVSKDPLTLTGVMKQYQSRLGVEFTLSETNLRGTEKDRLTWFALVWRMFIDALRAGLPLQYFCWWPLLDSCDWDTWIRNYQGHCDPVGIFTLKDDKDHGALWQRHRNVFSDYFGAAVRGEIVPDEVPMFAFQGELAAELEGYYKKYIKR